MTVNTRSKARRTRKTTQAKRSVKTGGVRIVYPKTSPAAIKRGRQQAALVRRELALLRSESLNEAMSQLRGREWS